MSDRIRSLDDFLALFPEKPRRKIRDGFNVLCPTHNDRGPSLSVTLKDMAILVKCQAGCKTEGVLKAKGLTMADLFLNSHKPDSKGQKALVATFSYEYEKAKEVYQIRRFTLGNGKKTFEAWHKNGGEYVSGMGKYKDKPILYHLPEISEWIATGKTIYLPEGELKADLIILNGGAATTSPFGAGHNKWRPAFSGMLSGAHVIILPDNDKPGYDFAQDKVASLFSKAASLKLLELPGLPDKGDIIDWFKAGNTFDQLEQLANRCPDYEPPADSTLPEIVVTGRHLRDITADALEALYKSNKPERIFRRSSALTRISLDEKARPFTETLSESALRGYLARSCNFVRISAKDNRVAVPPPLDVVRDIDSLNDCQFPPLIGITEAPVIRPDGTVMNKPGYDSTTNLYYYPSPKLTVPLIPDKPTDNDVKTAIELALEPVCDFPFDSEASRANAIVTMFTPILRPMIDGPAPLAIVDKPQAGTGASLLAEVISLIATGRAAAMMTAQKDDEGWRKAITSLLIKGQLIVTIDNVEYDSFTPSLAAILTATSYQDRVLGRSEMVILPNRTTWVATGNNIRLRGDLPRRCIWVRMDAKTARPWQRDVKGFKHPRLIEWVFTNRGGILAAILTIVRAWVVAGMPEAQGLPNLGGYESYCRIVGGVLAYMGVNGFLANLDAMYNETDTETPQWEGFLETWREVIGDKALTAAELISHLNDNAELRAALPDTIADTQVRNYTRKLGNALSKRNCVHFPNGLMISKGALKHHAVTWGVIDTNKGANSPQFSFGGELSTGQLPDCPACGRNEWTAGKSAYVCPCGNTMPI